MSQRIPPESQMGRVVQEILRTNSTGLFIRDIQRGLRERGQFITPEALLALLDVPTVFVLLSDGRYCLRSQVGQRIAPAPKSNAANLHNGTTALLTNLPLTRTRYIVIDLETTGIDPHIDAIFQLVLIKVVNGQHIDARNYYVNPTPCVIPLSLRHTLGLNPTILRAIEDGPVLTDLQDEIVTFMSDWPLVTHNARFEQGFLQAAFGPLPNPFVDTLEMVLLLYPHLANHRLKTVAELVEADFADAAKLWQMATVTPPPVPVDSTSLHNAVTDTSLLALVYQKLLVFWDDVTHPTFAPRRLLIPESWGDTWQGNPPDLRPLFKAQAQPLPALLPQLARSLSGATAADSTALLERYRADRDPRPGQAAMVDLVWQAFDSGTFTMVEAPTGTGKTAAYLIPAIIKAVQSGERIAISTAYRNLQDQVVTELDRLQPLVPVPFGYQVVKGIANYVCIDYLVRAVEETNVHTPLDERLCLSYLVGWALTSDLQTLDDINFWLRRTFPVLDHILAAVSAAKGACTLKRCKDLGCTLLRVNILAHNAHLLIINHDLWLSEPTRMPKFTRLVVDEAHCLEDVATRVTKRTVSRQSLDSLCDQIMDTVTGKGALLRLLARTKDSEVHALAEQTFASLRVCRIFIAEFGYPLARYITARHGTLDPRHGASIRLEADPRRYAATRWNTVENARAQLFDVSLPDLAQVMARLGHCVEAASDFPAKDESLADIRSIQAALFEQIRLQAEIIAVGNTKHVYWIEVASDESDTLIPTWALNITPIRVAEVLQPFYEKINSIAFVSATLALQNGDFDFFVDRLGLAAKLGSDGVHQVVGDLDYRANAFLGLTNYLEYSPVERTMRSFVEEFAKELSLLLRFTDGRALVLFTARTRMEAAFQNCMQDLAQNGIPLLYQANGLSRRQLRDDFAEQTSSVLMGLQSFWEGVDVPGEALSFVIMEKLPFPFLFDPVFKARREDVIARGQHEFAAYVFPLMAIRFKQGFGRLLRQKADRGAVIILDKRLHRKEYTGDLLASLPGYMPRDLRQERSRPAFYRALATALPDVINVAAKEEFLAQLPDTLSLGIVERLAAFRLPQRMTSEEYEQWRPVVLDALKVIFGYSEFRSVQEDTIRAILTGQDVLALMPTGAGKSLCFQLTALIREGVTVVFSPLIALMRDQLRALNERGIEIVGAIYSGQAADEREETLARMRSGKIRLVYIAPERIRDSQLMHSIGTMPITQIVVDEAHCVAMWGPSFRPDFLYVPRLFAPGKTRPPIAAFTATATIPIREAICTALTLHEPALVTTSFDRPELRFVVYNSQSRYNPIRSKNERFAVLLRVLQAADESRESVLVYVTTTVEADLLARRLQKVGYDARAYHGKMTTADRDSVQELFTDDQVSIVVCTKAFGMGIDKRDVRYVIHYHMPGDLESYYQEAGRAGRDGNPAYCILLSHRSDRGVHDFFIGQNMADESLLNAILDRLRATDGTVVYLDPIKLGDEFGMDEVQVKIAFHLLEQAGFVERDTDFTVRGAFTAMDDHAAIIARLQIEAPKFAALYQRLVDALILPTHRRTEIAILDAATRLNCTPEMLDALLVGLAIEGAILYRPWEKGFIIRKGARLALHEQYRTAYENATPTGTLTAKLETMIGYAANQRICRRATILAYFGQTLPPDGCGNCDVCAPDYTYPWSNITSRDTANLADFFDPAYTLLQLIAWSDAQVRAGRNRYSTRTLLYTLTGNAFMLGKNATTPELRRWRLTILRACPFWGIFDGLPNNEQTITKCIQRLIREDYITKADIDFDGNSGSHTYTTITLTSKGRGQLASGDILNWKDT